QRTRFHQTLRRGVTAHIGRVENVFDRGRVGDVRTINRCVGLDPMVGGVQHVGGVQRIGSVQRIGGGQRIAAVLERARVAVRNIAGGIRHGGAVVMDEYVVP